MDIIQLIPVGRKNAILRTELCTRSGLKDRQMRKYLEDARKNGVLILNLQDGRGYFRPTEDDMQEILSQYHQNNSRAMTILVQQKYLRQILKKAGRL